MEEIKVGDIVRVSEDARQDEIICYDKIFTAVDCKVVDVNNGRAHVQYSGENLYMKCIAPTKYLIKVNAEPKEKPSTTITIPVEADLTDSFWSAYEADLAKEIAVKLSNPNENKPGFVADYAVSVAKSVVEDLKKSER